MDVKTIPADELEWRLALDIGMTIDVFKRDAKKKLQMWSKGKIEAVTGTVSDLRKRYLTISYFSDKSVSEAKVTADSTCIAPYNTMSNSQNWRDKVQKGDRVDVFDKYDTWSTATVIWTDTREETEDSMRMIRVGFRIYCDDGDKSDSMGRYSGYSDTLDEYIGVYTCRI